MNKPSLASEQINTEKIKSKKTLDYLIKHNIGCIHTLAQIVPTCYIESQSKGFLKHSKTYFFDFDLETVWNGYLTIPPQVCWSGRKLGFSFSFDGDKKKISYENDVYEGLKANQFIFIEIRMFFGWLKLGVTHHVNQILAGEKKIKLCYVEGGKASGSQILHFFKSENGTEVRHDTFYRSDSAFRDKVIYPFVHGSIINQFHENIKRYLAWNRKKMGID
jgi:hypothetical protein